MSFMLWLHYQVERALSTHWIGDRPDYMPAMRKIPLSKNDLNPNDLTLLILLKVIIIFTNGRKEKCL
jgi:hypothetical protein